MQALRVNDMIPKSTQEGGADGQVRKCRETGVRRPSGPAQDAALLTYDQRNCNDVGNYSAF
jgi:hypothetical protein